MIAWLLFLLLLLSSSAWAAVTHVSPSGNNGNPCGAPETTPRQTVRAGMGCLGPGDTLYIHTGTYNERIHVADYFIPSGTSWSAPITIAGAPGETATVALGIALQGNLDGSIPQYLIFDNLTLRNVGDPAFYVSATCHHIRVQNSDLQASGSSGSVNTVVIGNEATFIEVLNSSVHDSPVAFDFGDTTGHYGFYINGSNMLIEGNLIYNNTGYGIALYKSGASNVNNNIVRNNTFYGNCTNDGHRNNQANVALITSGSNNRFYNNVVYNNTGALCGAAVSVGGTDAEISNNTIYGNAQGSIQIAETAAFPVVRNNIVTGNGSDPVENDGAISPVITNNLTANPNFTNPGAGDFTLQAGSAAIDAGVTIPSVPVDKNGVSRPQGSAYDIGAYEFGGGGGGPPPGPQALRWLFDEGSGTTAADATGNGYTGTLTASPSWGPGRVGSGSITMNGTSQYVTTGSLAWTAGQPVTVLLWHKVTAGGATGAFGVHSTIVQDRFGAHLPYSDNVCYFDYGNWQTTGRISVDCTPYLGRWTRFALVSAGPSGAFKAIYINGVLAASAAASGGPTATLTTLDVGRWVNESGTYYDPGSVDDVRLDNRVWSAAEILTEYRTSAMARRHRVSVR